jgi:hypothetical protein
VRLLPLPAVVLMVAIAAERAARGRWGAAVAFALPAFALLTLAARPWKRR